MRLVLIAGPSSSGKTTFSKRLAVQLLANGIRPIAVEMDSYFVDREQTPRDEQGNYNFEVLEALDLKLFNEQLLQLMAGEEVTLPKFNFVAGKREAGRTIQLGADQILLVEGIHGLNPRLVPNIPPERIFRLYISALTQLNIDRYNRVPTTDMRLLRRIVRDARPRLLGGRDHRPLGERASGRARLHLPLPGKRRRDVQLGAGVRAVGAQAVGGAAAVADRAGQAGLHRSQAAAHFPAMVRADPGRSHPRQLDPAGVRGREQSGTVLDVIGWPAIHN